MSVSFAELSPDPNIVDVLRGTISEPIQVGDGETVSFALEGPGMFGLADWEDNKRWFGIISHCLLSGRLADDFAKQMVERGHAVDRQLILDGSIVSHPGRRRWEEARKYPKLVPNSKDILAVPNETIGLRLIYRKVPEKVFWLVASLGYSDEFRVSKEVMESWEHRFFSLADHWTSDRYAPVNERMGDFLVRNFFDPTKVNPELTKSVHSTLGNLLSRERNYRLGISGGQKVTVDEAIEVMQNLGAGFESTRHTLGLQLSNLLKDAGTEAALIREGINLDNINDETVPMPAWEGGLRYQYVAAARESIVHELLQLELELRSWEDEGNWQVTTTILEKIDNKFPSNTRWGEYAWRLYKEHKVKQDNPQQFPSASRIINI